MAFGTDGLQVIDWDKQTTRTFKLSKSQESWNDILIKKINWKNEKIIKACNDFWNTNYTEVEKYFGDEYLPLFFLKELVEIQNKEAKRIKNLKS